MKKIYYIFIVMLLATVGACTDDVLVQEAQQLTEVAAGEIEVNIGIGVVGETGDTRSFVAGENTPNITSMKLLCFDMDGLFVAVRDAEAAELPNNKIKATVPSNTARVHFVANYADMALPGNVSVMREATLMRHSLMSVDYTHQMTYWGYHRESSSGDMIAWLQTPTNKVWLLRDRAKVVLSCADTNVSSFIWSFSNGLKRGLVAPRESNDNVHDPYTNNYYNSSTSAINTVITQYTDGNDFTYTITEPSSWTTPAVYEAAGWTSSGDEQYLFESRNMRYPVKMIVRVTYTDATVKYHAIKLLDADYLDVQVRRNEHYKVKLVNLPKEVGYDYLEDAINSTTYSNDRFSNVGKDVLSISTDTRILTLTVGSLKFLYQGNEGDTGTVQFKYTDENGTPLTPSPQFTAVWLDKDDGDTRPDAVQNANSDDVNDRPTVTYNTTTGIGTITFTIKKVEDVWKYNELRLICKDNGLMRDIDVFSYNHRLDATLTPSGSDYILNMQIVPNMPEAFFPMTLRLATKTLQPAGIDYDPSKIARVMVESTSSLAESSTTSDWNYKAKSWNYWYEYPIEFSSGWLHGLYKVTMKDVRGSYQTAPTPSSTNTGIGLYLELKSNGRTLATRTVTP